MHDFHGLVDPTNVVDSEFLQFFWTGFWILHIILLGSWTSSFFTLRLFVRHFYRLSLVMVASTYGSWQLECIERRLAEVKTSLWWLWTLMAWTSCDKLKLLMSACACSCFDDYRCASHAGGFMFNQAEVPWIQIFKKNLDYQIWPPIFADQLADSHTLIHPPLKEPAFVHTWGGILSFDLQGRWGGVVLQNLFCVGCVAGTLKPLS